MAKKTVVYHVNENRGCMYYCVRGLGALLAIGVLMAALGYIAAVAAGVGLWFLSRAIWRRMVVEMPGSGFVKWGLGLAPIMRKVIAGIACALLSVILMAAWGSGLSSSSSSGGASQTAEGQRSPDADKSGGSEIQEKEVEERAVLTFSDVTVDIEDNESSSAVRVSISGTVTNDGNVRLSSLQMPDLMRGSWKESLTMDENHLEPGESTTFTYEGNADWDEDYSWSFRADDKVDCMGLDGIAESLTQMFNENKDATAAAREEAARKSAEEAEQRRAEAEQRHLESSCWVTPSGTSYHEDSGCYLMHGSKNLTEMTVAEARAAGYDPCDNCAY